MCWMCRCLPIVIWISRGIIKIRIKVKCGNKIILSRINRINRMKGGRINRIRMRKSLKNQPKRVPHKNIATNKTFKHCKNNYPQLKNIKSLTENLLFLSSFPS